MRSEHRAGQGVVERRATSKSTGSGEISHPRFLHLVRRDALRRHCSLDCILAPLLRVRLPLGLLSRRRRHIDVRQHLHAAVGPGDVPDHVVGDAALLRVLARVRRCQDTQGGGRISRCANGSPCRSLCAACCRASALTLGRVNSGADAGFVSLPWDNRGVKKRRGRPAGARTRTSAILASMVLYSSGLAATLALRSAANPGCAHERARNHHAPWNRSTASRHGRLHFGAHTGARALGGARVAGRAGVCMGGREVSG